MEPTETRRFSRMLDCELGAEVMRDLGEQMAALQGKIEDLEAEKKAAASAIAKKINDAKGARAEVAKRIRTKREERMVTCFEVADHSRCEFIVYRDDNGEEVERRTMTAEEVRDLRQTEIDLDSVDIEPAGEEVLEEAAEPDPREEVLEEAAEPAPVVDQAADLEAVEGAEVIDGGFRVRLPSDFGSVPVEEATAAQCGIYLGANGIPVPAGTGSLARRRKLAEDWITGWRPDSLDAFVSAFGPFKQDDAEIVELVDAMMGRD